MPTFEPTGSIPGQLMQKFYHWVGTVWVNGPDVPTSAEELAGFDIASLIPEYHAYIAAGGQLDLEHGLSMQQNWLMAQLTAQATLVCVINTLQPPQPTDRITRIFNLNGDGIIEMLRQLFRAKPDLMMSAGVYDGDAIAHVITLQGVAATGNILFHDPWPGRSLLCQENNSAGVSAELAPGESHVWMLPSGSMAAVIHYVLVPQPDLDAIIESRLAEQAHADVVAIEASEFFQWFHLEKADSQTQGSARAYDYRPSGPMFRETVILRIVITEGQGLTGARLILHRSFVDSPRAGVFAADLAKSFVLFLSKEPNAQALAEELQNSLGKACEGNYPIGGRTLTVANRNVNGVPYLELTWH